MSTPGLAPSDLSVPRQWLFDHRSLLTEDTVRLLTERALHFTAILDEDGTIRYVSDSAETILGYTPEFLRGRNFLSLVHAEDWPPVITTFNQRIGVDQTGQLIEFRCRHASGGWRSLEVIAQTCTADRWIGGVVINGREVTDRKWSVEHLQRQVEALRAIAHLGHALRETLTPAGICLAVLEGARALAGVEGGAIFLRNARGRLRVCHALGAVPPRMRARRATAAQTARHEALVHAGPRFFRLPPLGHVTSELGGWSVPMQTQDRVIGVLEVYGRSLAGPAMSEALSSLADQGACALDRSRVYGDMVAQERRVKQVVRRLVLAQEHERRRVAFEVHDGLAQLTVAAHHYLEAFASGYRTRNRDRSDQLEHARDLLRRTVCEARRLIGGLLPTLVNEVGLAAAVQFEVEGLRADGWHVEYIANIGPDRLAAATELALFRVAQEALANVRKHAGQSKVRVTLERRGHAIHLEVRDWGRGFRQTRSHNSHDPSERIGLVGMRERVSLIGGRSSIRSRPGCGTRVTVDVQLPPTIQILRAAAEPGPHA